MMTESSKKYQFPAPWDLRGDGIIIPLIWPKSNLSAPDWHTQLPAHQYAGRLGALMLVDYQTSTVGPYRELLMISGKYRSELGKGFHIPKIWVDSEKSRIGGRENWGIPKEMADFDWHSDSRKFEVRVSVNGKKLLSVSGSRRKLKIPVSMGLLGVKLVQQMNGMLFHTRPQGAGKAVFVKDFHLDGDSKIFPGLQEARRLPAMWVSGFRMQFPVARMLERPPNVSASSES